MKSLGFASWGGAGIVPFDVQLVVLFLLLCLAVIFVIFKKFKLALTSLALVVAAFTVPIAKDILVDMTPWWFALPVLLFFAVKLLRLILVLLFGEGMATQTTGQVLSVLIVKTLSSPFILFGMLKRSNLDFHFLQDAKKAVKSYFGHIIERRRSLNVHENGDLSSEAAQSERVTSNIGSDAVKEESPSVQEGISLGEQDTAYRVDSSLIDESEREKSDASPVSTNEIVVNDIYGTAKNGEEDECQNVTRVGRKCSSDGSSKTDLADEKIVESLPIAQKENKEA